jgi:hypothetical protein
VPPFRGPAFRPSPVPDGASSTPAALPQATTLPATNVTGTSAFLNGSVNPEGLATSWWFAWGITPQYGNVTATVPAGSGTTPANAGVTIGGVSAPLTAGATYHFAMVAQSAAGTVYGADMSFVAQAPQAVTNASNPLVPFGTVVDTPHFAWPFTLTNTGANVVEQDTLAEIFSCVQAIAVCPVGACPDLPGFGIPDLAFANAPVNPTRVVVAIQQQEPRASQQAIVSAVGDPNLGSWQVGLTTRVASEGGQQVPLAPVS